MAALTGGVDVAVNFVVGIALLVGGILILVRWRRVARWVRMGRWRNVSGRARIGVDWMYGTPETPHRRVVVFYAISMLVFGVAFLSNAVQGM